MKYCQSSISATFETMSNFNNSFDYNVQLLGLLPLPFKFVKEENLGVRFQTDQLQKVKKPSEDHHDGQVIISDEQLLQDTAIAEAKIIRHKYRTNQQSNRKDVSDEDGEVTSTGSAADGQDGEAVASAKEAVALAKESVASAKESVPRLNIEDRPGDDKKCGADVEVNSESESDSDESTESSTEAAEPGDKMMLEEHSARFLYKCYYNVDRPKPDFLSYRLPLMYLAIKTDPYFFKVNKIRFKPYGCENEMEFIQIHWPKQLDKLYENPYDRSSSKGWSGPMFNKWATTSNSSHIASEKTSHGDDAKDAEKGDSNDGEIDSNPSCKYHRAYIQAELKPTGDGHGSFESTRGFNIVIAALVGGVWNLEEDPKNYTCQHLAEMRTATQEVFREHRTNRYNGNYQDFFYKRVRMLSNYWQCYLAGETNYLVGINGRIGSGHATSQAEAMNGREIKELRLYDVSKIPGFIKKCGVEQGFRPWSKEILQNRLYKALSVIYDKVIEAPVDTEFMFVKYNEFDPPVHDVDGGITGPYLLAFRQVIIEGLPTPPQPQLVINLINLSKYPTIVQIFEGRRFTREDLPKTEDKEHRITLTFESEKLAEIFLFRVSSMLKYMKDKDKFPVDLGMENLSIKKVLMDKPVPRQGNNSQSWRTSSNRQQQQQNPVNNSWMQAGDTQQSWRRSNQQQQQSSGRHEENSWRRGVNSTCDNFRSWRISSIDQHQQSNQSNNNRRQQDATANFSEQGQSRSIDGDGRRQHYDGRRMFAPNSEQNWRQK